MFGEFLGIVFLTTPEALYLGLHTLLILGIK